MHKSLISGLYGLPTRAGLKWGLISTIYSLLESFALLRLQKHRPFCDRSFVSFIVLFTDFHSNKTLPIRDVKHTVVPLESALTVTMPSCPISLVFGLKVNILSERPTHFGSTYLRSVRANSPNFHRSGTSDGYPQTISFRSRFYERTYTFIAVAGNYASMSNCTRSPKKDILRAQTHKRLAA